MMLDMGTLNTLRSRRGSGSGVAVGWAVGVARNASKVGFGVTVAIRLGCVGLGVIGISVGGGDEVGMGVLVAV